jgi:hypothetical protein
MIMPYSECPKFDVCSSNKCPLDPNLRDRIILPGEDKCTARKSTRVRIAAKYPELLPYQGLTSRSWLATKRWGGQLGLKKEE